VLAAVASRHLSDSDWDTPVTEYFAGGKARIARRDITLANLLGECVGEISAGFAEQYLRGVLGSRPFISSPDRPLRSTACFPANCNSTSHADWDL
jgi:hypothetical protein